jgi:hypothetical protein
MAIRTQMVDELLEDGDPKAVLSTVGPMAEIKKAWAERMLNAYRDVHLDSEPAAADGALTDSHRNGYSMKAVLTESRVIAAHREDPHLEPIP